MIVLHAQPPTVNSSLMVLAVKVIGQPFLFISFHQGIGVRFGCLDMAAKETFEVDEFSRKNFRRIKHKPKLPGKWKSTPID